MSLNDEQTMPTNTILLSQYKLNSSLTLKNRIVMAPMTRTKADNLSVPTQEMAEYYARRADAGLIVTEGTLMRADALGHHNVPGIYTQDQIAGWKRVTNAVHANGGILFMQLWHVGRVSHPEFLNGKLPISASATEMTGSIARNRSLAFGKSRAASLAEIQQLITDYAEAAKNAIAAGADGVEIHGANGYLIDQFLHYNTNHRQDEYGGTPANMVRFALEVVKACGQAIGFERVGLRLSPGGYLNQIIGDERDAAVFRLLLETMNQLPLAYVHTGNFNDTNRFKELEDQTMTAFMRKYYHGTLIAAGSYTFETAQQGIQQNEFDLVAIGRPFIANPDLIERLKENASLNAYDVSMLNTLY